MSEANIQKDIMEYLKKIPCGKVFRLNGQGTIIRGHIVKQKETLLDILFLFRGQAYFFEVKTPTEKDFIIKHHERLIEGNFNSDNKNLKRYKDQIEAIREVRETGNVADFVCSVEDVKTCLHDL